MAFSVNLYTVAKRRNSTKLPAGAALALSGALKNASTITSPDIAFNLNADGAFGTAATNPSAYNYAYIPSFSRYYWIESWEWRDGLWIAHMSVDVLATYRTQIAGASLYVLRSAVDFDPDVLDSVYPATADVAQYPPIVTSYADWTEDIRDGCFVIGLQGQTDITYYGASYTDMMTYILPALFPTLGTTSLGAYLSSTWDSAQIGGRGAVMSYIHGLKWFPFPVTHLERMGGKIMYLGNYSTGETARPVTEPTVRFRSTSVKVLDIEQMDRGTWPYVEPYASYYVNFPPFGLIKLPGAELVANDFDVELSVDVNVYSGAAILYITAGTAILGSYSAQVGFDFATTQGVQSLGGALGGLLGTVGAAATGNVLGAVSGVVNAASSLMPKPAVMGGTGGCPTPALGEITTYAERYYPVDEDRENVGRPLCRIQQPTAGYNVIQNGRLELSGATPEEITSVQSYLEGGFYNE